MASIIFLVRGTNQSFEVWKKFMETQMFIWKRQRLLRDEKGNFIPDGIDENGNEKFKRGNEELTKVQGALRPMQIFEYTVPEDLDVYGFLKHYRDLMSWSEPSLAAIGTTDAMIILEKFWRQKIAKEIEAHQ